jgi:hypothetical protein
MSRKRTLVAPFAVGTAHHRLVSIYFDRNTGPDHAVGLFLSASREYALHHTPAMTERYRASGRLAFKCALPVGYVARLECRRSSRCVLIIVVRGSRLLQRPLLQLQQHQAQVKLELDDFF